MPATPSGPTSPLRTLQQVPLFADLLDKELRAVAERAVRRRFQAGEIVFTQGQPYKGLYVVESGTIRTFRISTSGREQVLSTETVGCSLGELPAFDDGAYTVSAMAASEARLLFVSKRDFRALCREHPDIAFKALRVIGARLRRFLRLIEDLSFATVRRRLVTLLFYTALNHGRHTARGIEFVLPGSKQEIAAQIGTVRELVSRNLSRLCSEGAILLEGRKVVVPELKLLEAETRNE